MSSADLVPVPIFDPTRDYHAHKTEYDSAISGVLESGRFIMGPQVAALENELSEFVNVKHSIGVASGTDALLIALMAIDLAPDDEVITVPFTWISTAEVIALLRGKTVFADIDKDTYLIDMESVKKSLSPKTKAIIPISLFGQMYDVDALQEIIDEHEANTGNKVYIIEDAAQSFGAMDTKGRASCSVSDIGCTSFFPTKPLGCYGDGGACFTNDDELAHRMRAIRTHGCVKRYQYERVGVNGRLDTLQAAVLLVKLKYAKQSFSQRGCHAAGYHDLMKDIKEVTQPALDKTCGRHVYAQYTMQVADEKTRDELVAYLKNNKVGVGVFYPAMLHLQPPFANLGYMEGDFPVSEDLAKRVLSIPVYPEMTQDEQVRVVDVIREFFVPN